MILLSFSAAHLNAATRLVSSSPQGVVFEIEIPQPGIELSGGGAVRIVLEGYGSFSRPGSFLLPGKTFHVAIPPEGKASVDYSITVSDDLGELNLERVKEGRFVKNEGDIPGVEYYLPEGRGEGESAISVLEAGAPAFMSRQRVLPVMVSPVYLSGGRYRIARKMTVRVAFAGGVTERPGAFSTTDGPASKRWQRIYDDLLVNPRDVEKYIKSTKDIRRDAVPFEAGKRLKIKIPETGVYAVRADSLISSGMSSSISNTGFSLNKLYFDQGQPGLKRKTPVPYRIIKGTQSSPSIFEGDDIVVFYARGIKDDAQAGDQFATFTDYNIIWLEEDEAGTLMDDFSPAQGPAMPTTLFDSRSRNRKDTYYNRYTLAGKWDFYYIEGPLSGETVIPFEINSPDLSNTFTLSVRLTGSIWGALNQSVTVRIRNSAGTNTAGTGILRSTGDLDLEFTGIPSNYLADGTNELVISGSSSYGFLVNDFEIIYPAGFNAAGDILEFSLAGKIASQAVTVSGFSEPGGFIIDISDAEAPLFLTLPGADYHLDGNSYSIDLDLLAMTEKSFVISGRSGAGHIYNDWISVDNPSAHISETGPFDALVIAHSDFLEPSVTALTEYKTWREDQGFRILKVDVEDIYDEFNGGLKSTEAIKRFIRFGHDNWGVDFVLLVGDGNEDHKQIFYDPSPIKGTPPDYIPPFTYSVDVIGADYDDEVIATDKYYAFLDEEWPQSGYPDVFVGRLPVGGDLELRALLIKMYRFEDPKMSDQWRRRTVLFADDAWSGYPDYRYHSTELHFEQGMERIAQDIESSLPGGFDIQRLFLSSWTDSLHDIGDSGINLYSEVTDSTREYFTPYILARLNEGALIFSFQGHAHRAHLSTESGFSMFSQYRDLDKLTSDRNFIFFGAGCHISQYAIVQELSRVSVDGPNGDCISEQMLFKSRSGAVSAYASSGFELLDQNETFFDRLHETIFKYPPDDLIPPAMEETGAHWNLGEALTKAEIEHIGSTFYGFLQSYRYFLLGDPMITVDPGPPMMILESDWGEGWQEMESDTLRSKNRSNMCRLRLRASDVISLGEITLFVDDEDRSGELSITRIGSETTTWARGYYAEIEYDISLEDGGLTFNIHRPGGRLAGQRELVINTRMRMFYNGDNEVMSGGEVPPSGDFRLEVDFPVFLAQPPLLLLDGTELSEVVMSVPSGADSTHWEVSFSRDFIGGSHEFSVRVGEYSKEFAFEVTGGELAVGFFSFPNPFSSGTNISFTNNIAVDSGKIMIYNVSGRLIRKIEIPPSMLGQFSGSLEGEYIPNHIWWDGRDLAGNRVANGNYIIMLRMEKDGKQIDRKTISVKLE